MQQTIRNRPGRALLQCTCLAAAIIMALGANQALAAQSTPTPMPTPKALPDAAPVVADSEQARRELEQMREQMREMSRKMADLSARLGDVGPRAYAYRYIGDPDRGMIGIVLSDDVKSGTHGLHIDAVTPGGPADKAGLKHGDMLTSVDGKPVAPSDDEDELPGPLHDVKVGQNVKLGILRDGKSSQITVKAERREPRRMALRRQ